MQRSIDSFFKKGAAKKVEEDSPKRPTKKRKALVISSDEEDNVPEKDTQEDKNLNGKAAHDHKKTRRDNNGSDKKKPLLSKLKASPKKELKRVNAADIFGGETFRVEAKKPPKPKDKALLELEDEDIDRSLLEVDIDDSVLLNKKEKVNGVEKKENKTPSKAVLTPKKMSNSEAKKSPRAVVTPKKTAHSEALVKESSASKVKPEPKAKSISPKKRKHDDDEAVAKSSKQKIETPKAEKKTKQATPRVKKEQADLNSSVLTDEERHERKRMTAILYQKYKNRSSCINPGSKEVPKGKPNCLAGFSFLVTGVLESLERDECGSIIKEYGGKVMSTVGKRLNYLIVGEEAGPKKLAQAEEFGIKILSEDDLFNLIRERSGETTAAKDEKKEKSGDKAKEEKKEKSKSPKKLVNIKTEPELIQVKKENLSKSPTKKFKEEPKNIEPDIKNKADKVKVKQEQAAVTTNTHVLPSKEIDEAVLAWVDKYKPKSVKEIVGQQGAASNAVKLTNWLSKWYVNHDGKKKMQRPNPWAKNDDGSFYKAALLSGPPGIGKTTTATLVCKELGFDVVEFNASDTRSKRLLKEEVAELLSNKSLYGYFHGNTQAVTKKHVLIMDEVDGMAGNEDRGGIQELIGLIKESSVPIICMCNDRNHQKMRSLVNHCYDLRFNHPRLEQIKACVLSICFKEQFKLSPAKIEEIIRATNNDIRQSINHISLLSAGKQLNLKADSSGQTADRTAQKDLKMGPWEVVRKVFSAEKHKHMNLNDKCDLFFHDYSLSPLFVQQNYLQVSVAGSSSDVLRKVALTADALSLGDLVDKRIRSNAAWSLLPTQAVFSSVMPGEYMSGYFSGQVNFPGWLGKNSRTNKRSRLAQEIHDHTRLRTSGSRLSVRLDYAPYLLANIVRPLKEQGLEGVEQSLAVIKEYHLLREDIESLIELTTWPGKKGPMDAVDGRVKAALTRTYNKEVLAYSYSATAGVKKKRAEAAENAEEMGLGEEDAAAVAASDDEKEDDDDLANDGLIKAKKKTTSTKAVTAKTTSSKAKPSTSKKASASTSSKTAKSKK